MVKFVLLVAIGRGKRLAFPPHPFFGAVRSPSFVRTSGSLSMVHIHCDEVFYCADFPYCSTIATVIPLPYRKTHPVLANANFWSFGAAREIRHRETGLDPLGMASRRDLIRYIRYFKWTRVHHLGARPVIKPKGRAKNRVALLVRGSCWL